MSSGERFKWVSSAPALVALALGGIYALGAAAVISQLNAADLDTTQVMPLIPIDQILARGIGAFTAVAVLALPLGLLAALGIFLFESLLPRGRNRSPDPPSSDPAPLLSVSWFALAVLGVTIVFAPTDYATILVFGLIAMFAAIDLVRREMQRQRRTRWRPIAFLCGYFAFVLVATLMSSIARPDPLPLVALELTDGKTVRGLLVTSSGSNWHVAREGQIIAIPSDNTEQVKITYSKRKSASSLFDEILD